MRTRQVAPKDIDQYIAGFPPNVQEILEKVRSTIQEAAPDAEERISYQIPSFHFKGLYLVYFAAFEKHIGVYPAPVESEELKEELALYRSGKATVRFAINKPIPLELISRIVKFRMKENLQKAESKRKKK
jgi:uncharacterized protein YdhG (YjbR/CyaY superfamily)